MKNRRGAILVFVAIAMVALMSVVVIALDGGILQRQKRIAQSAADAATQAGAIEIFRGRTDSTTATARGEATRNGYTNGVNHKSVTVTYPNMSSSYAYTGPNFVRVVIQDTVTTLLGGLIGRSKVVVTAQSVGGVTGTTQNCFTALDSLGTSFEVESGANVQAVGCNIAVNSSDGQALRVTGSTLRATGISVVGNYFTHGGSPPSPPPVTGAPPVTDPLASTINLAVSDTSGACTPGTDGGHGTVIAASTTIGPGVYCGGINISKSTTTVAMTAGIYVIKGGGFSVSSAANVIGNGIAIVNLNAPAASGGAGKFDVFDIASGSTTNFTAMTTGPLAGILFYSPKNQGVPGHVILNRIHSSVNVTMNGSIYFPDQTLYIGSSGATLTINGGIVAKDMDFASDSRVNVTGFAGASPYSSRRASVVE